MKLMAIGLKKYVSEKFNLLDGGVVLISIVEMILISMGNKGGAGSV